jgi:aminopeptidase N
MKTIRVLFFVFLLYVNLYPQDKTVTYLFDETTQAPDYNIKIEHLTAYIKPEPYKRQIDGKTTFTFQPYLDNTDSISFILSYDENPRRDDYESGSPWEVKSVKLGDVNVKYKIDKQKLIIHTPSLFREKSYDLTIEYTVKPVSPVGMYFVGWDDEKNIKRKQIWAHRPSGWLPYYDGRLTVDMFITFDNNYKVLSNGERISVESNADNTSTWHYKMSKEHPFFSTAFVIGDYAWKESKTSSGLPLELWYYPELANHVEPTYQYTEKMFEFFDNEFGFSYPYPLYREVPVIDYLYGAMETTTSTVYGDFLLVDERGYFGRNYVNVNAHELTHQWFGNYLSHLRGMDVWLTESFATYFAKIFEKDVFGEDYYQNERNNETVRAFNAAEKDNYPVGHSHGGTDRFYPKGSLVLDMLRYVLGDEGFKLSIKHYLEKNKNSVVETSDFLKAIQEATGKSLEWFFDEWIYKGGEPLYKVAYKKEKNEIHISVSQIQDTTGGLIPVFKMPVVVEIHYKDKSVDKRITQIENKEEEIVFPDTDKEISFILFDPERRILKKIDLERTFEELSAQALDAVNMIDRYDALLAMKDISLDKKKDFLLKCYEKENFHLNKSEIINQLAQGSGKEIYDLIKKAINDPSPLVRKTVLTDIVNVPLELQTDYEKMLKDPAYYNVESALTNLCASFNERTPQYLDITKNETGWRGRNIRIKWLEIKIKFENKTGIISKDDFLKELIDYSSKSYEFETRINALNALKNINYLDEESTLNLFNAYLSWHYKLSGAAKGVFDYFYQKEENKNIINAIYKNYKWTNSEKKTIEGILE